MDRDPDPIKNLGLRNNWLDPLAAAPLIKPEAFVLINGELPISRAAFEALPEYSTSLPTGTRPGKVWKRQSRVGWHWLNEWTMGTYGEPFADDHELAGRIPISWYPIRLAGQPASFPRGVRIPPAPMRGRIENVVWPPAPEPVPLPDGVWELNGRLVCHCQSCGKAMDIECEPEEFELAGAYCGGSPRCVP